MNLPLDLTDPSKLNDPAWVEQFNLQRQQQSQSLPGVKVQVTTETGLMPIKHGLGRVPTAAIIVRADGSLTITDQRNAKAWDTDNIYVSFNTAGIVADIQVI